jgi:hypothetical protein
MKKRIILTICLFFGIGGLDAKNKLLNKTYFQKLGLEKSYDLVKQKRVSNYCDTFLVTFPKSKYAEEITKLNDELFFINAYDVATKTFEIKLLEEYLEKFPNGLFKSKIKDAIDIISWQKARNKNTIESYKLYLSKFPNGKAILYAKEAISSLQK